MKVVLDTNILVSASLVAASVPGHVLDAWGRGEFELVTSEWLLSELAQVVSRPALMNRLGWSVEDAGLFVEGIRGKATLVSPDARLDAVLRDPDDNRVLEAAVAGEADYIVTGDKDLLDLREYQGIRILTPAQFLAVPRMQSL